MKRLENRVQTGREGNKKGNGTNSRLLFSHRGGVFRALTELMQIQISNQAPAFGGEVHLPQEVDGGGQGNGEGKADAAAQGSRELQLRCGCV